MEDDNVYPDRIVMLLKEERNIASVEIRKSIIHLLLRFFTAPVLSVEHLVIWCLFWEKLTTCDIIKHDSTGAQ